MRRLPPLVLLILPGLALAQQLPSHSGRSPEELWLSLGVLGFGLILITLQVLVMLKLGKGWGPASIRVVGLTLVVVAGLFLITAGYSENQAAPMVGLLGTITGYLLGKSDAGKAES